MCVYYIILTLPTSSNSHISATEIDIVLPHIQHKCLRYYTALRSGIKVKSIYKETIYLINPQFIALESLSILFRAQRQ